MTITCLSAPSLAAVPHGFLGRTGGVSTGLHASLNVGLGSHDDPAQVRENRARATAAVAPGAALVTVHQIHSPTCVVVKAPWSDSNRPAADALVTDRPGLALGVLTADCGPVLLADPEAGVVGAAHAGWGGALGGVIAAVVIQMVALGAQPARIRAAVGPCIAQRSYEVGDELRARFAAADESFEHFFASGRHSGKYQFDLEGLIARRLADAGVKQISLLGEDTYAQPDRFFSFRRATHAGEADYGRQISLIALPQG